MTRFKNIRMDIDMFKRLKSWLLKKFRHECEFMVLGVMEASVGEERTIYGIAICKHFLCSEKIYFPEEYRVIHEKWIIEGKRVSINFERNMYMNYD